MYQIVYFSTDNKYNKKMFKQIASNQRATALRLVYTVNLNKGDQKFARFGISPSDPFDGTAIEKICLK